MKSTFRLVVLNPGGNDPDQGFPDFAGMPNERAHPPVNYHAYAACTGGGFRRSFSPPMENPVLLILRRDLKACLAALNKLKPARAGSGTVAVSIKESGQHQVAQLLADGENLALLQQICALADGCISSTQALVPLYHAAGAKRVEFIPTPYPVDDRRWDFSIPIEHRRGVFIGTREFDVPSRNHAAALLLAKGFKEPVTVINTDGRTGRRQLAALGCEQLNVIEGPLPYPRYLRLMSKHRIVFQLDRSAVPGQIAGDALLCRVPCIGGDSAIERLVFAGWHGHGRDAAELANIATQLLGVEGYEEIIERINKAASELVSFNTGAAQLRAFYETL